MSAPLLSVLPPNPTDFTREHLAAYFENAWRLYEELFATLDDALLYEQPDPLRHPLVFYLGHTAAFYINKLHMAGLIEQGIDPDLDALFARGVDPHAAGDLESPTDLWPDVETVRRYRDEARAIVEEVIDRIDPAPEVDLEHPLWALFMAIEHDRIHFETSSMLIRQLDHEHLTRPAHWPIAPTEAPSPDPRWVTIPARSVTLGRGASRDLFGWDNEYGERREDVPAFEVGAHLVSNAEFDAFVKEGGYEQERFWSEEGWGWRTEHEVAHPRFWVPCDRSEGTYHYRALFEVIPMPRAWPVEVNAHEAEAFCRWAGARLMTEAEHHAMCQRAPSSKGDVIAHPDYNLDLRFCSPSPVDHYAPTPDGVFDAYGNVWQWLSDTFSPLEGFAPHPLYEDFSEPYFDEDHVTLRGGAWATTGAGASRFYRLWFRRHFYQHAGFRLARTL